MPKGRRTPPQVEPGYRPSRVILPVIGEKRGRITITRLVGQRKVGQGNRPRWIVDCVCECGKTMEDVIYANLRSANTKSCGCLKRQRTQEANTTHGATALQADSTHFALWKVWGGMKQRCRGNTGAYAHVNLCAKWLTDFAAFRDWALANGYAEGLTIDRINVLGNYSPDNCRWATTKEQANNRTSSRYLTLNGKTQTVSQWADDPVCPPGITSQMIRSRIHQGWSVEEAITAPQMRLPSFVTYDGSTLTIPNWADDPRCVVGMATLRNRIKRGWKPAAAITTPAFRRSDVPSH